MHNSFKYIQTENLFNNINIFFCFYSSFDQIYKSLASKKRQILSLKKKKETPFLYTAYIS